ncbi:MAG: D-alanyl-D-alanine carboxypeptidase family protein [Gaiella sp.]
MRRRLRIVVLVACVALAAAAGALATSSPPAVDARAYLLVSGVDGSTLAARAPDEPRAIASITKLMTVLVALEHSALDEVVAVPYVATTVGESGIAALPGEPLTVAQLAVAALVPSANDAATALAWHAGGGSVPRFVAWMNGKARKLGMTGTRFRNPHGLDQRGHVSTARDTVILLRAALQNRFIRIWSKRATALIPGRPKLTSTDRLIGRMPELVGAKTGQTSDAGWSQVAAVRADGISAYGVVLGAPSRDGRDRDLEALLRFGLTRYRRALLVDPARTYATVPTGWGLPDLRLVSPRAIARPAPVTRPLVERVVAPLVATLPVRAGQRLGEVRVYDGSKLVARAPLVSDRSLSRPGLVGRLRFYGGRTMHHLTGFVT